MAQAAPPEAEPPLTLYTIGHSTRPLAELVSLLNGAGVRTLVDVRTGPHSRTNPQFNKEELEAGLERRHGISYTWLGRELGGLRKRNKALACNDGWENASFRGYADYMQEPGFAEGVDRLLELARSRGPVAYMCAEVVYFSCHRMLLSDALLVRGHRVVHLGMGKNPVEHKLTRFAVVEGTGSPRPRITYPHSEASERKKGKKGQQQKGQQGIAQFLPAAGGGGGEGERQTGGAEQAAAAGQQQQEQQKQAPQQEQQGSGEGGGSQAAAAAAAGAAKPISAFFNKVSRQEREQLEAEAEQRQRQRQQQQQAGGKEGGKEGGKGGGGGISRYFLRGPAKRAKSEEGAEAGSTAG